MGGRVGVGGRRWRKQLEALRHVPCALLLLLARAWARGGRRRRVQGALPGRVAALERLSGVLCDRGHSSAQLVATTKCGDAPPHQTADRVSPSHESVRVHRYIQT